MITVTLTYNAGCHIERSFRTQKNAIVHANHLIEWMNDSYNKKIDYRFKPDCLKGKHVQRIGFESSYKTVFVDLVKNK